MENKKINKISLFHGTTLDRGKSIAKNGFAISKGEEDWLGSGVYFFLDGVTSGLKCAQGWAQNTHNKQSYCVLKATIEIPSALIFDLTSLKGLSEYNCMRDAVIDENYQLLAARRDLTIKKRKDIRLDDKLITSKVMEKLNKKLLIHNVYIKNMKQRKLILESSYPNSTAVCLSDLSLITEVKIVKQWKREVIKY